MQKGRKEKGREKKRKRRKTQREKEHSALWRGELREMRKIWSRRDKAAETVNNEVRGGPNRPR